MTLKLSKKLSLVFSSLFAIILSLTAVLVFTNVKAEMTDTLKNNLETTSDLIKRIVEVSIDNKWGQIEKNMTIAENMLDEEIAIDDRGSFTYNTFNEVNEKTVPVHIPEMKIGNRSLSQDHSFVREIQEKTGGEVTIYQKSPEGFVSVCTTIDEAYDKRGMGSLIPAGSPIDILVRDDGTHIGRDYFLSNWYLTAYRLLYKDGEPVGILYVALKQVEMEDLRETILSIVVGNTGFPYIIDTVANAVIHPSLEGQNLSTNTYVRDMAFEREGHRVYPEVNPEDGKSRDIVATYKYIPAMNWIVIASAPTADFYGNLYVLNSVLLLIFGIASIASISLSVLIGNKVTEPVRMITNKIKDISEGEADLNKQLPIQSNDEIGELARYFNTFVSKLKNLQEVEQREVELQLRDAQMNALQAQINPHFLYNTLETIRFMIAMKDNRAMKIVQYLADLFRISIGKGERYVKIRRELEHVQLYISIQKMRYSNRFTVHYDIDEEVYELYTLKFILQPIVENTIHHGFELIESGGIITIRARCQDDRLIISVQDNGSGISAKQLRELQDQLENKIQAHGVGLVNVYKRIHLHFGDDYTVSIQSKVNEGTTVTLVMPVLKTQPSSLSFKRKSSGRLLLPSI